MVHVAQPAPSPLTAICGYSISPRLASFPLLANLVADLFLAAA
jgi:hypothetical protein